ncbi:EF-hand calcium-binding domain-containing protein 4A-like isoform X2 [Macrosteles quadrilineatus]|uniref:EF-hand calcium-binding domain-containing protein 4A-like isoform X2 n=1 Tax=Macrosteles quadrilineatus TaxID=74068 RepID=UPI0023E0A2D9|nr:EF-hand calcium-binding domain-containing protein 4A-like isoform X2 [Macrosteles quadrilineatus]
MAISLWTSSWQESLSSDGESDKQSEAESDLSIERLLSLNVLHKSGELMCEVRSLVGREDTWHQLLAALFSDLNQLLRQISQLEDTLKARDRRHQQEIRRIYEELENQVCEEREQLQNQIKQKEATLKTQFFAELEAKEQQLLELVEQRDKLQQRLNERTYSSTSTCLALHSSQDERSQSSQHTDVAVEQSYRRAELRAEQSYVDGFRHAQHLAAIEEEGLVKQLRLLQQMQDTLRPGLKTDIHKNIICDDT